MFRFLPGHRNFILRLPAEIRRMKEQSSCKQTFTVPPQVIQGKVPEQSQMFDNYTEQQDYNAEYHVKIERLQNILIEKLVNAGNDKNRSWVELLNTSQIVQFEMNVNCEGKVTNGKCHFICPFCSAKCLVNFDRFWQTSNLLKHLNVHEVNDENMDDGDEKFELEGIADGMIETELETTIQLQIESLNSSNVEPKVEPMDKTQAKTETKYKPKKKPKRKVLQLSNRRQK